MVVVLMGVSGSGKSTIGRALAAQLGWAFVEGDDFHPPANVEKMRAGVPLGDEDRRPWLRALRAWIEDACAGGKDSVLACSALKHEYREFLEEHDPACVRYAFLHGPEDLIRRRLAERRGHFMDPALLHSQFETLEAPGAFEGAIQVDITPPPGVVVAEVRRKLGI